MAFKLRVVHKPTGFTEDLGPWPTTPEMLWFAQGFVRGTYAERFKDQSSDPADVELEILEAPDPQANTLVASLVAEASAIVTHPDGTVD
jgi:hypothetical protein